MGEASRKPGLVRQSLDDARALMRIADSVFDDRTPQDRQLGSILEAMRSTWEQLDRVLLRCDPDLVGAARRRSRHRNRLALVGAHAVPHRGLRV
jgi:ActR/RegA family two-component response regulator